MITARDLGLSLDGRTILDGVAFDVARGEAVALVGPNGSGKTSILRCILGLVPFTGRVAVDGHDVVRAPLAARACVAYVPQKAAFGDVSARDALAFIAAVRRIDRGDIDTALATVGLERHADESVRRFSGGMQQRLSLAAALLADTPVLLLDEPTASLDAEAQATFVGVVERLRRDGRTLLLASHRPEEVERLTERVLHVDRGRIVAGPHATAQIVPLPRRGVGR